MTDNIKLPPMPDDLFDVPGPIWGHILDWHEAKPGRDSEAHVKAIEAAITKVMNDHAKAAVRLNAQAVPDCGQSLSASRRWSRLPRSD